MRYILFAHLIIMGIQAYIFGKRFGKTVKDNEDEKRQQLVDLNERLKDMYYELTQEQDTFQKRRDENTNIHEGLNSKKCELQNRLDYLEGIRYKVGESFVNKTTSLKDFNELCKQFVSAHDDIEKVQIEIHESEIELETYLQTWNDELTRHNEKVNMLRSSIDFVLAEISKLNMSNTS